MAYLLLESAAPWGRTPDGRETYNGKPINCPKQNEVIRSWLLGNGYRERGENSYERAQGNKWIRVTLKFGPPLVGPHCKYFDGDTEGAYRGACDLETVQEKTLQIFGSGEK